MSIRTQPDSRGTGRPEHMRDNVRAGLGAMPDKELREKMAASLNA